MKLLYRALSPGAARARMPVLIFHRVLSEPDPLFPFEPDRHRFARICARLARWFQVLPLDEAIELQRRDALPPRALSITFDDGYADNHDVALPVLRAYGLCATFFVATGFLDGGCMWNDRVIAALRHCRRAELDLGEASDGLLERYPLGSSEQRRQAIERVLAQIKYLPPESRLALVDRILESAGVPLPRDLMMTSEQVRALRDNGMQIGAHTVSHPIMARLDRAAAAQEIHSSREHLQSLLGERVGLFAYPNGRLHQDYDQGTVDLVRELGFDAAVTTNMGVMGPDTDLFQIPRYTPWETDIPRFALRLAQNMARGPQQPVAA